MDGAMNTPDVAYLLSVAGGAIVMLLVLIMRFKVHAFVALTLVSMLTALATGVTYDQVIPTMLTGFGGTLASVALLVGLGAMIGRILEMTGGAKVLADTLINRFGSHRAPFALGVASLLFGFPIFFDAGLIVMLPIIFSVAKQFGGSVLKYALPSAGAFAVMHAFLPPHPGPVAASELLVPTSVCSPSWACWSRCPPGIWVPTCSGSGPARSLSCPCPRASLPVPSSSPTRRRASAR